MKKFSLFLASLVVAAPMLAQTAPSRVAVIDVRKVLSDSNAGKAAFEKLRKMQEERAGRVQKMNEELASLESQIKQKQLSLSEDKLAEMNKQFTDKKVALTRYAQSFQAYTQPEYTALIETCGFSDVTFAPALTGAPEPDQPELLVVLARKPSGDGMPPTPEDTNR